MEQAILQACIRSIFALVSRVSSKFPSSMTLSAGTEASSQQISSLTLSFARVVGDMAQDGRLAQTYVVLAHFLLVGDVTDQSITCNATLRTLIQAAWANAVWQFARTGRLILHPREPLIIRTAGKHRVFWCQNFAFDYYRHHRQLGNRYQMQRFVGLMSVGSRLLARQMLGCSDGTSSWKNEYQYTFTGPKSGEGQTR